jgi:aryl-alcohol dehydrogenase-like predicted oxidoreductase
MDFNKNRSHGAPIPARENQLSRFATVLPYLPAVRLRAMIRTPTWGGPHPPLSFRFLETFMHRNPLGRTGIEVSRICLGTMTFGTTHDRDDAFRILDRCRDAGVDFVDVAEMYPFPTSAETQGLSEAFIGEWLSARKMHGTMQVATKITGPMGDRFAYIRGGDGRFNARQIETALDASLKRLQTDVVDLYQLHWPERKTNYFGALGYTHVDEDFTPLEETLSALARALEAGKIRAVGLSNETPWGAMTFLALAEAMGLPRMASIQNPYNLLNRTFEVGLAEIAIREDCGLLAYSPLGFGALSGKYLNGRKPPGARLTLNPDFTRYVNPRAEAATVRYVQIARDFGLDPAAMALAFVNTRRFTTSNIIGVRTMEQLEIALASDAVAVSDELLAAIDSVHADNPNPSP